MIVTIYESLSQVPGKDVLKFFSSIPGFGSAPDETDRKSCGSPNSIKKMGAFMELNMDLNNAIEAAASGVLCYSIQFILCSLHIFIFDLPEVFLLTSHRCMVEVLVEGGGRGEARGFCCWIQGMLGSLTAGEA